VSEAQLPMSVVGQIAAPLTLFMALLLMATSAHKLFHFKRARNSAEVFAGVPPALGGAAAGAVLVAELLAAVLLLIPAQRTMAAAMAAVIWSGYGFLMIRAIAQGRAAVDCGCSFGAAHAELGVFQIFRNGVLIALVMFCGAAPLVPSGVAISWQILAAFTLFALYAALDQVMSLKPLRSGVMN